MNVEEILDFIKTQIEQESISYEPDVELSKEEAKQLLDCITNLQDTLKDREEYCFGLETQLTDYKSKNEKAIEYMNNYIEVEESNEPVKIEFKEVRNILQGEDKDDR